MDLSFLALFLTGAQPSSAGQWWGMALNTHNHSCNSCISANDCARVGWYQVFGVRDGVTVAVDSSRHAV